MESIHASRKLLKAIKIRLTEYKEARKNGEIRFRKQQLYEPITAALHPIKSFNAIKTEGFGSGMVATAIAALFFLLSIVEYFETGFVFNQNRPEKFNVFYQFAVSAAGILVWSVVNWALCTLLDGKGSFREIWIVVCYGLTPKLVLGLPMVALSRVLCLEENAIFTILQTGITLWCVVLIFVGLLIIHEYSFSKTLFSCLLTLLGIVALLYLLLLFISMLQQFTSFIQTVFQEAMSRR